MLVLQVGDEYLALRQGDGEDRVVVFLKPNSEESTKFGTDEKGKAVAEYYREDIEKYLQIGQGHRGSKNHYNIPMTVDRTVKITEI